MATKGARTSSAAWGEDRVSRKYGLPKVSTRGSTVGKKARVGGKRASTPRAHVSRSEKGTYPQEMKAKWVRSCFAIDLVAYLLLNRTSLVTRAGAEDTHACVPYPRALC